MCFAGNIHIENKVLLIGVAFMFCVSLLVFFSCSDKSIEASNRGPRIEPLDDIITEAYEDISVQIHSADDENDQLIFIPASVPAGALLTNNILSWTPDRDDIGQHNIQVIVSDGRLTDTADFNVTVNSPVVDSCVRIRILRPQAGESFDVGDTLTIVWAIRKDLGVNKGLLPAISPNAGATSFYIYDEPIQDNDFNFYKENIGIYNWKVAPEFTDDISGIILPSTSDSSMVVMKAEYQENTCTGEQRLHVPSGLFEIN